VSAPTKRALDPTVVTARLIQAVPEGTPGAVAVLGGFYAAQDVRGMNGARGMQQGHYERWLGVEGPFTLTVPNTPGPDGKLNIQRFLQRTSDNFQPGDEWLEIRRDGAAQLLYVGALINIPSADIGQIQVGGYDALWLLKKVRETDAGFWNHAPRDALEYYTRAWVFDVATTFPEPGAAVQTGATGPVTTGSYKYSKAYTNTGLPLCRLDGSSGAGAYLELTPAPPNVGTASPDPHEGWRVEASIYVGALTGTSFVALCSDDTDFGLLITASTATSSGIQGFFNFGASSGPGVTVNIPASTTLIPGTFDIALEGRDRWIYVYVQGTLCAVVPQVQSLYQPITKLVAAGPIVDVQAFSYRRSQAWLMRGSDKGDYVLPGEPVPGGLQGSYYDDHDLLQYSATYYYSLLLSPDRQPYTERVDPTLNFGSAFEPPGPANDENFSAIWTGSIYLDLENFDYRVQATVDDAARVWIGKTRFGEQIINSWSFVGTTTSGYLRASLGEVSGWYPIRIEYANALGAASFVFRYERSDTPGTFNVVPASMLSPEGIYQNQVRQDSHYDTYQSIAQAFGYQYTCEPKALESGLFPGQVIPRVRVGRDTNVRVGTSDTTNLSLTSSGEDQAVMIAADASGIADPNGTAQLSAIAVNYAQATNHMFAVTESESLSDITDPNLLAQRLNTLLALRSGTWDQVASNPPGHPVIADAWPPPVVPLPAKFAYLPGDGVLRDYPEFGIVDTTPTQLMSIAWDFTPFGIIAPQASYFIYPRGTYWTLRRFRQQSVASQRNFQGQLGQYTGTMGGYAGTAGGMPATVAADGYSRLPIPANATDLGTVWLHVMLKLDPTITWTIEVNGINTGIQVKGAGLYDITAWAAAASPGTQLRVFAHLIPPGGATDTVEYALLATTRITV
jgi:hypothetical protein